VSQWLRGVGPPRAVERGHGGLQPAAQPKLDGAANRFREHLHAGEAAATAPVRTCLPRPPRRTSRIGVQATKCGGGDEVVHELELIADGAVDGCAYEAWCSCNHDLRRVVLLQRRPRPARTPGVRRVQEHLRRASHCVRARRATPRRQAFRRPIKWIVGKLAVKPGGVVAATGGFPDGRRGKANACTRENGSAAALGKTQTKALAWSGNETTTGGGR
jgi:hypothetical protein